MTIGESLLLALGLYCAVVAIYLFLVFPGRASQDQKASFVHRNFAHRGFYDNDNGVPENSLKAFEAAMQEGYGCELDVQFTRDKKLIVFHDNDFLRICGVDKKVWEMDWNEVCELRLAGTDERVPTFREVLDTVAGRNPLIVEIKAEGLDMEWYTQVCEATAAELKDYKGEYCIESFHPGPVRWVWKNLPDVTRGLLVNGPAEPGTKGSFVVNLISELLLNFTCRPQFIAYRYDRRNLALRIVKKLGAFSVMWTVPNEEEQRKMEEAEDCIIFEHYHPHPRYNS
ncbi:MAG: glycerophosphodiester phosphodiesterase [Oscillospiraceae bacterium]|nr:glycerophosphodiester phosphodiesterase [Oscillospiraceae bacterium]